MKLEDTRVGICYPRHVWAEGEEMTRGLELLVEQQHQLGLK